MNEMKKAALGAATPKSGRGGCLAASDNPHLDFTTLPAWRQARIAPMLGLGKGAAMTAKELADFLSVSRREISRSVERERNTGIPICASTDRERPGYYLPADAAELAEYRRSFQRRVAAVSKTLQAVESAHDDITGQQRIEEE